MSRAIGRSGIALGFVALTAVGQARDAGAAGAAIESVAGRAGKGVVASAGAPALVVAAPLASDVPAPRGGELAERVAQLVAGAIGGATHAAAQPASLAQARVLAGKEGARLVFAQTAIARGSLRLTLDAYPSVSNGWDRVRNPEPPPSGHAFAEAPLDAEVRAYLGSIALEHASVHRAKHDERDVLAAACGDLDGDGGMELVLVSRARIAAGHLRAGRFMPTRTVAFGALAPRVPVPFREPLGGAAIVRWEEGVRLLVGSTDRGGIALDGSLARIATLRGIPVPAAEEACATPVPEVGAFQGDLIACGERAITTRAGLLPASYDAVAIADVVRPDGSVRTLQAGRDPNGSLQLHAGDAAQTLDGVGAQIALGDLDQDGVPEIVTSGAGGAPGDDAEDAIRITSWDGASDPRIRLDLPTPAAVRAFAICPPEEGGTSALVAVVGSEVWIVR